MSEAKRCLLYEESNGTGKGALLCCVSIVLETVIMKKVSKNWKYDGIVSNRAVPTATA